MLVGSVVGEDRMDHLAGGDFAFHSAEEADELLMTMALHVGPNTVPSSTFIAANRVAVPFRFRANEDRGSRLVRPGTRKFAQAWGSRLVQKTPKHDARRIPTFERRWQVRSLF